MECGSDEPALRHGPGELDHSRLRPTRIKGTIVAQGDFLATPNRIVPIQDYLVVGDDGSETKLHILRADGSRIRSIGREGAGPGEFKGIRSVVPAPGADAKAWVYDVSLSRMTEVDLAVAQQPSEMRIVTLAQEILPIQPLWLGDTIVSPNFSDRGRLTFFGPQGQFLHAAGPLPRDSKGTPSSVLQQAWMGHIAVSPRRGLIALATFYADQLEIYRSDGSLVRTVRGPFRFDPKFETADAGGGFLTMSSGESMRIGYSHVAATDDEIYALFSGRTREAFGGGSSFGRFVHVYDWDGELKRVLELDEAVVAVSISPDRKSLYAVRHDPEPAILAFPLPTR
ncbi:MAG TPA: BF3164 family lipoprotein [Longimicrobium sp.]|nr:BF3164 family lipoprotein [Longimicrobium sp.]